MSVVLSIGCGTVMNHGGWMPAEAHPTTARCVLGITIAPADTSYSRFVQARHMPPDEWKLSTVGMWVPETLIAWHEDMYPMDLNRAAKAMETALIYSTYAPEPKSALAWYDRFVYMYDMTPKTVYHPGTT